MMNSTLLNRSGLAAIAAATAFLSTPALAQDATPVTADAVPVVADPLLPTEPAATPDGVGDPLAPAATTATTTRTPRTIRPTRATAAPAVRPARAPAARAAAVAAPPTAAPFAETPPAFDPAMVAPLPEPVLAAPAPVTNDSMIDNDLLPIAGAAGLVILGLAGAGLAMRRRRRDEDEVVVDETFHEPVISRAVEPVAVAAPPIAAAPPVAKPAFNWGNAPREPAPVRNRIEAARRGPTPDNPSLSLKKRMQRAAFFDRHERQVAAGTAEPMSPMAGLPDALATVPPPNAAPPVRRPGYAVGKSHSRTFQPA